MKTFRPVYDQLTAEERAELVLASIARGDFDESTRLDAGCPRVTVVTDDRHIGRCSNLWGMWA